MCNEETLRELAKKHGLDFDAVADQQEECDVMTGKRGSLED